MTWKKPDQHSPTVLRSGGWVAHKGYTKFLGGYTGINGINRDAMTFSNVFFLLKLSNCLKSCILCVGAQNNIFLKQKKCIFFSLAVKSKDADVEK